MRIKVNKIEPIGGESAAKKKADEKTLLETILCFFFEHNITKTMEEASDDYAKICTNRANRIEKVVLENKVDVNSLYGLLGK